jgi:hypothetical protein
MARLDWVFIKNRSPVGNEGFYRAATIINLDLMDLCEGRFWGSHVIHMSISFSIHERNMKDENDWPYQLLAPNGVHIYCRSKEEGKEIAEVIYARILAPLIAVEKETPFVRLLLLNKDKNKKAKLEALLKERKIDGEVYYSNKNPKGWMHLWTKDHDPQRLGYDYASAVDLIAKGTMDFMSRDSDFMKAKL